MITTDEIRTMLREKPFTPIRIRLADGDSVLIPHPEFALVAPTMKRHIVVANERGHTRLVNLSVVVSVDRDAPSEDAGSDDASASGAA